MVTRDELCFASARDLAQLIRQRELSPVEVAESVLARIEALDFGIAAFCALDPERVRVAARQAEAVVVNGEALGPLHGVPVSIKDLIFTKDLPTVGGCEAYAGFTPDEDDVVVERLRRAGAIILGKTNVPIFGFGSTTFNAVFGTTRNPWSLDRTPGGSSGGSAAAVAAGMGPVSIGSDGGGSIRVPASFCGVYGLKPSFGRVPLYPGCRDRQFPGFSAWESVEHIGPLTRTVTDAALVLDVISGPDPRDRHSLPWSNPPFLGDLGADLTGVRIAWTIDMGGYARVDAVVGALVEQAVRRFEAMGAIVENDHPGIDNLSWAFEMTIALESDLDGLRELVAHYPDGAAPERLVQLLEKERTFLDASRAVAARKDLYNKLWRFFERYDLLLTPTAPVPPFSVELRGPAEIGGEPVTDARAMAHFTSPFNFSGHPAASVPCGWTPDGLPVGIQIVGNHLDDRLVLRASRAFEIAAPWTHLRPPSVERVARP